MCGRRTLSLTLVRFDATVIRVALEALETMGCDTVQGYFLERPVSPNEFSLESLEGDRVAV